MLFANKEKPSVEFSSLESFDDAYRWTLQLGTKASKDGVRETYWNAALAVAISTVRDTLSVPYGDRDRLIASLKLLQRNT